MLSHIAIKMKSTRYFIVLFFVFAIFFGLFARGGTTTIPSHLINGIECKKGQWDASPFFSGDPSDCPDLIEYVFKPALVDEKASEFVLRFLNRPSGKFGLAMRNSGLVMESYSVDVDTVDSKRLLNKDGSNSQGATIRAKMSKENTLFFYPFDKYFGEIKAQAFGEVDKEPIPGVIIVSDSSLSGWNLSVTEKNKPEKLTSNKAIYKDGLVTLYWKLSRANVVYISVGILLLLMLIALMSALAITRSIAGFKRPPSMNLLLWLATVLFATLQVRSNFPDNPPIGILLDFIVVFPVLGLFLILGIANTFYWLKRTDWDYENEKSVLIPNA